VALFKQRVDPLSAVVALVEAIAANNEAAVEAAAGRLAPLSTQDIFYGLFQFGQTFAKGFTPEHKEVMREELAVSAGPPEFQAAVEAIGLSLLYKPVQATVTETINTYGAQLVASDRALLRQAALLIVAATGRISRRLDIKFHWK
jgi:hypothetical protein